MELPLFKKNHNHNREEIIKPLVNTLAKIYKNVVRCKVCGNLKSTESECSCIKSNYDQICVVENIADMWVIQNTGIYKGNYHILGGTLPSLESQKSDGVLISTLIDRVKKQIRFKASPRHVPSKVISISDIPRTKNGKIVELAVKNTIEGNEIKNIQALANPEILKEYKNLKELKN